jgi:hypothetical protein
VASRRCPAKHNVAPPVGCLRYVVVACESEPPLPFQAAVAKLSPPRLSLPCSRNAIAGCSRARPLSSLVILTHHFFPVASQAQPLCAAFPRLSRPAHARSAVMSLVALAGAQCHRAARSRVPDADRTELPSCNRVAAARASHRLSSSPVSNTTSHVFWLAHPTSTSYFLSSAGSSKMIYCNICNLLLVSAGNSSR